MEPNVGDWVMYSKDGELVIGQVLHLKPVTVGYEQERYVIAYTTCGEIITHKILEIRKYETGGS